MSGWCQPAARNPRSQLRTRPRNSGVALTRTVQRRGWACIWSRAGIRCPASGQPGQTERIYVSAQGARFVRIRIFRIGWYGGAGGREVLASARLPVAPQPLCTHQSETGLTECDWHPTLSFQIPQALPSGVYIGKLSTPRGMRDVLFVVTATHPQPLLAQLPNATYRPTTPGVVTACTQAARILSVLPGPNKGWRFPLIALMTAATGAGEFFQRDVAMAQFWSTTDTRSPTRQPSLLTRIQASFEVTARCWTSATPSTGLNASDADLRTR